MMDAKKLTRTSLLAAAALVVFVIEAQIPPLTPIPGIKSGLSNIFSLVALTYLGPLSGICVTLIRIILGGFLTGQVSAMLYSFAGAVPSFVFCLITVRYFKKSHIWPMSCISAVIHNLGQLVLAVIITQTPELAAYLPLLIISGVITGAFTGICSELVFRRISK